MRTNLEDSQVSRQNILSAVFGNEKKALTGNYTIPDDFPPIFHFLDANGSNRNVMLPAHKPGLMIAVANVGSGNSLVVKDMNGTDVNTLGLAEAIMFISDGASWWQFNQTITGADFLDPTEITSPDNTITTTVVGNALQIDVNLGAVDHNQLLNYSADRHIDHTAVSISAGLGLSGGGTIAASRTIALDINGMSEIAPVLGDSIPFYDISGTTIGKTTLTAVNAILDHNALLNYSANRHVDHTSVTIVAGTGLTGGGDISSSRTLSLDINGLTADTPVSGDFFVFYDVSGSDTNKVTLANLFTALGAAPATSGTAILKGNGSGGFSSAVAGTDYLAPAAIGVTVQAYDAELAALAGLTSAADRLPYFTGSGSASLATFTSFARTLLDDTDAATMRATLGLTTTDNPQFATIELGAASDTTISRSAAGVIAVEGVPLFSNIPQNSQSAAYTAVLADANKHILHPSSDNNARTFTIPANSSVAYPIGTFIMFINEINTVTISITTDTLTLAGTGSTGSRTLAANGMATAVKVAATKWVINGTGLT